MSGVWLILFCAALWAVICACAPTKRQRNEDIIAGIVALVILSIIVAIT